MTGKDLSGVRFTTALRGYRASEVDTLIERLARSSMGAVWTPRSE